MQVLIAPDSFKGSLSANLVAQAIETGWKSQRPNDQIRLLPLADGGEGTLDVIHSILGGEIKHTQAFNSIGELSNCFWLLLPDGTAIIEMAKINGLTLLNSLKPLHSHTQGLGQLIRQAAENKKCKKIVVALGGSATSDGGVGALYSLGVKFLNSSGFEIVPSILNMFEIANIDLRFLAQIQQPIQLLTDVSNPFLGKNGAARVFSPQKGANAEEVEKIEAALNHLHHIVKGDNKSPGMGAAGGTAYGLKSFFNAEVLSGADTVLTLSRARNLISNSDVLITGEGRLDDQSFNGKLISRLLSLSEGQKITKCAVVGQLEPCQHTFDFVEVLITLAGSRQAAMESPEKYLQLAGQSLCNRISQSA